MPKETARAFADIDNSECQLPITTVKMALKREIKAWTSKRGGHTFTANETIAEKEYAGLDVGETRKESMELNLAEGKNADRWNKGRKEGKEAYSEEDKALGELMQASVESAMLQCNYYLEIKPVYGDCDGCQGNNTKCILPLIIFAPSLAEKIVYQAPQIADWAPQVYPAMELQMPGSEDHSFYQKSNTLVMGN